MNLQFFQMLAVISGSIVAFGTAVYGVWKIFRRLVYITDAVQQLHPGDLTNGRSVADKVNTMGIQMNRLEERMVRVERKVDDKGGSA